MTRESLIWTETQNTATSPVVSTHVFTFSANVLSIESYQIGHLWSTLATAYAKPILTAFTISGATVTMTFRFYIAGGARNFYMSMFVSAITEDV